MTTSTLASPSAQERRTAPRVPFHGSITLEVLDSSLRVETQAVNISKRGLCLRVQESLDINSRLRMQLRDLPRKRPLACQGRVSWVVQRLDLSEAAPFIYDVGIEFIDPSNLLRRLANRLGLALVTPAVRTGAGRTLRPAVIRNRLHIPCLTHEPGVAKRWHLVISIDDAPCFSRRYSSSSDALEAWRRFKRNPAPSRPQST